MLSSCANPSCVRKFRYLHEGKLFLLQSSRNTTERSSRVDFAGHVEHLHYAWLCDRCSQTFEVVLDSEERIKVRTRYDLTGLAVGFVAVVGLHLASVAGVASDICALVA